MKYNHILITLAVMTLATIVTGVRGIIPFKFSLPITAVVGGITLLYWWNPNILSDIQEKQGNKKREVDPANALEWLNQEYIPKHSGYRKIDIDQTKDKNRKLYTKIQPVFENGEKKVKFGVVGRPKNVKKQESIAYVVHCDEGWVEYSGELHTSQERLDPFEGRHKWIENEGVKARTKKDENTPESQFNIYNQENPEVEK